MKLRTKLKIPNEDEIKNAGENKKFKFRIKIKTKNKNGKMIKKAWKKTQKVVSGFRFGIAPEPATPIAQPRYYFLIP